MQFRDARSLEDSSQRLMYPARGKAVKVQPTSSCWLMQPELTFSPSVLENSGSHESPTQLPYAPRTRRTHGAPTKPSLKTTVHQ